MANIPDVFGVINFSILFGSILKVWLSISQKTGFNPDKAIAFEEATNEKGDVMISPFNYKLFIAKISPIVPFETTETLSFCSCFLKKFKNLLYIGPLLERIWLSQILSSIE